MPARALRVLGRKADVVVGLTAWERAFMIRQAGISPERCVVVGNGVDPVELGRSIDGLPEEYVVSVGTVSARKGQAAIAAALAGNDLPYVVVGGYEGDDPMRSGLPWHRRRPLGWRGPRSAGGTARHV